MWILLVPLVIAEIVFWGTLAFCAWRATRAFRDGNWPLASVFLGLIALPFVVYSYMHMRADAREAARAAEIAALTRSAPPQAMPKLLEVYGHATEFELLIFLDALNFQEVIVFQRPRRENIRGRFVTLVPECRGRGVSHLETWKRRGRFTAPTRQDKDCLIAEWKTVSANRAGTPALEYRHGTQATLVPPGTNWASGAYEVRLRTNETSKLLAYWERPYITRPAEPGPWGYAYPANTDRKTYKQPKRLKFLLQAIGFD